jgi:CelD/BcsL family acetyltransferase involved in cellulose biosynthesis
MRPEPAQPADAETDMWFDPQDGGLRPVGSYLDGSIKMPSIPAHSELRAPPDVLHTIEIIERHGLARIADAWRDLAARALEPNAFLTPAFACAALTLLADARDFKLVAVWRIDPDARRLTALLAVKLAVHRWALPIRLAVGMAHNYGPLGMPLLDRDRGMEAAEAFLEWLARGAVAARFALFPFLTQEGPAAHMLARAIESAGLRRHSIGVFRRALARRATPGRYLDTALDRKKRRELARQRRRLEERGVLVSRIAIEPADVVEAVEAFLKLELHGWKGRRGTATLQREDRKAFLRAALSGMAAQRQARLHVLELDGQPIAIGIALVSQDRGWFWKIAYDEDFARYSPGVQVAVAVTDDLLSLPDIGAIDSVADPGNPLMEHLWRERLALADWLVDLTPGGSALMPLVCWLEGLQRAARSAARTLLHALRR